MVNDNRAIFKVRSLILLPIRTGLGLDQTLTLNGYSSGLTQFT